MNFLNRKIEHPGVAFLIYFVIGAVLAQYGIPNGTYLLIALLAGIIFYKLVTS